MAVPDALRCAQRALEVAYGRSAARLRQAAATSAVTGMLVVELDFVQLFREQPDAFFWLQADLHSFATAIAYRMCRMAMGRTAGDQAAPQQVPLRVYIHATTALASRPPQARMMEQRLSEAIHSAGPAVSDLLVAGTVASASAVFSSSYGDLFKCEGCG